MRILTDFHHSSLLRSLKLLFVDRLGHELYRPLGMEWFTEGYWKINDLEDTAKQFLDPDQQYVPADGTPPLNLYAGQSEWVEGRCYIQDPGGESLHMACSLDYFKNNKFDILIASLPQHIEPFKRLIQLYQPNAKLIFQVGNNWDFDELEGMNVLASTMPRVVPPTVNACFYHQEIDLKQFHYLPVTPSKKIYSFVNIQQNTGPGWEMFLELERLLPDFEFRSFGGQCRDGSMTGDRELADKMREAMFIYHVKPGGDGFGHVLHDAYAIGRPVITRRSDYVGMPGGELMVPGTCIDLDQHSVAKVAESLRDIVDSPVALLEMGDMARDRFRELVNYEKEGEDIAKWLETLF